MLESKKKLLPFKHGVPLTKKQCLKTAQEEEQMRVVPYASVVGTIMYAMLCIGPDIWFAVGMIIRYQSNPRPLHSVVVNHIHKNLQKTTDYILVYQCEDLIASGYIDSDI